MAFYMMLIKKINPQNKSFKRTKVQDFVVQYYSTGREGGLVMVEGDQQNLPGGFPAPLRHRHRALPKIFPISKIGQPQMTCK